MSSASDFVIFLCIIGNLFLSHGSVTLMVGVFAQNIRAIHTQRELLQIYICCTVLVHFNVSIFRYHKEIRNLFTSHVLSVLGNVNSVQAIVVKG